MKRSTRMMLMSGGKGGSRDGESRNGGYDRGGRGYDQPRDSYDGGMYDRFRDDRGREHYDNGRYAPMRSEGGGYIESRFRDRDGREHYDNGRFAPMRGGYDGGVYDSYGPEMHYTPTPYIPPIYQERGNGRDYSRERTKPMNKIGFVVEGEADRIPEMDPDYRQRQEYQRMNEMQYRKGGERRMGYSRGNGYIPFTRELAEEWTSHMENEDGTRGPHWSMEQTKQVQAQRGIECPPEQFYAILNAVYSDYCKVAKKHNVNTIDFYSDLAKAWLDDSDAVPDKASAYYEYVVKH